MRISVKDCGVNGRGRESGTVHVPSDTGSNLHKLCATPQSAAINYNILNISGSLSTGVCIRPNGLDRICLFASRIFELRPIFASDYVFIIKGDRTVV
jgi:hypothetical protein